MNGLPLEGEAAVVDAVATQTTKGTLMVKRNDRPRLTVTADGRSVVGHAGARLLSDQPELFGHSRPRLIRFL